MAIKQYSVLVCAVTFYEAPDGRELVLLLRRSVREKFLPGAWGLPCGKVEFEEDLESGVLRELQEEAGISGDVDALAGVTWFTSQYKGNMVSSLQLNFVVRTLNRHITLNEANDKFEWVDTASLPRPPIMIDDFTMKAINQGLKQRHNRS